jgi:hypothetical protein
MLWFKGLDGVLTAESQYVWFEVVQILKKIFSNPFREAPPLKLDTRRLSKTMISTCISNHFREAGDKADAVRNGYYYHIALAVEMQAAISSKFLRAYPKINLWLAKVTQVCSQKPEQTLLKHRCDFCRATCRILGYALNGDG